MNAGNVRACREMHEPDAVAAPSTRRRLRSDSRFPFPADSESTSARESEKCFPESNTLRPGVCLKSEVWVRLPQPADLYVMLPV